MKPCYVLALCGTLLIAGVPAGATSGAAIRITPSIGAPLEITDSGPGPVQAKGNLTDGQGSTGAAAASADSGVAKIQGTASGAMTATAGASFGDVLTISAPGVFTGTLGELGFSIVLSGELIAVGGVANWRTLVQFSRAGGQLGTALDKSGVMFPTGYLGDTFGIYSGVIPFVYGTPVLFTVLVTGAASSQLAAGTSFDLSRSLYWNGISGVTARGIPVDTFDLGAQSGADWRGSFAPVPEPATVLLFAAGSLWLALRATTRRARKFHRP